MYVYCVYPAMSKKSENLSDLNKKDRNTRFLSYRQRHMVFSHKKKLKGHPDNLFITENLTRYRYGLLKKLNSLRADGKLHSFWTHDGSIIVKRSENS